MTAARAAGIDAGRPDLPPGEFALSWDDFRQIADMVHTDAGIYLPESKAALVYSRLAKRLRALGLASFRDYCRLVGQTGGADERQEMVAALTTNVTRFFREPHHFAHLKKMVLPPLIETARNGARVRLWSAACSNGQEPFSIALTVLSLMPDAAEFDIKVLATDIDPNMVAEGRAGTYAKPVLDAVPVELRKRWFVPAERGSDTAAFCVGPELRDLVAFRELNLLGGWPMKGPFQAIFCRNVAIYFQDDTQAKLWSRFAPVLAPGGRLYIGHSERLTGSAAAAFEAEAVTTYRLRGRA